MKKKNFKFVNIILLLLFLILIFKDKISTKAMYNENKTKIPISYSTDNKYIYIIIVSITSLVINAGKNTLYIIYILHTPDFTENSKKILNEFETKYKNSCRITFINMGDRYKNLKFKKRLSISTYYRLSLHDILPNINKIIYLDGDTLVFRDLKEL